MSRVHTPNLDRPPADDPAELVDLSRPAARRAVERQADLTDTPRCPVCRFPLVLRVDCLGCFFSCACLERRDS
jgi:hypothetical protein